MKNRQRRVRAIELSLTPQQVSDGVAQRCSPKREPSRKGHSTRHHIRGAVANAVRKCRAK
jgi:hypothetical protein